MDDLYFQLTPDTRSMTEASPTLNVHSIESFGTHDGPGIRLVVFLQGCNLKCLYCQNADTIQTKGGQLMTVDEIVRRAVNMKPYFGRRGGVTISGGEPLLQSKRLIPLFERLKAESIHTNIDTNATVAGIDAQKLISELSDLVMFDMKHTTEAGFENLTGRNGLQTAIELIALREKSQKPYWLRYVLIPGYTNKPEYLQWLIDQFSGNKYLERVEILPYHKLGQYKWEALGEKYQLEDVRENTPEEIEQARLMLEPHFKEVISK
ncbi:pyruvate formate-lyase-activating protein [Mangrovibacterium marinum]|uniref:pyruvate formate-lyase-activating protein n=1 Tax=Mangrovibacterium marinum TaxID=1639118 RepID=UPI002A1872C1|nr:pyruvate formate-lyase-activating protein [Mangrovibacterium marinum]